MHSVAIWASQKSLFLLAINRMDPWNTGLIYSCPGWLPDPVIIYKHVLKMTGFLKAFKLNLFYRVQFKFKRGSMCLGCLERKTKSDWKAYIRLQSCNRPLAMPLFRAFVKILESQLRTLFAPHGRRGSGDGVPSQHVITNIDPEFWLFWHLLIQLWSSDTAGSEPDNTLPTDTLGIVFTTDGTHTHNVRSNQKTAPPPQFSSTERLR